MKRIYRPKIWSNWSKSKVISISDSLDIHRITFTSNNRDGTDRVNYYMEFSEAMAFSESVLNGRFVALNPVNTRTETDSYKVLGRMELWGGGKPQTYGGKIESRLFEIEAIQDNEPKGPNPYRFVITIKVGEGKETAQKTIVPKDMSQMISQRNYLTAHQMYEMASIIKLHLSSWYASNMYQLYDEKGEIGKRSETKDLYAQQIEGSQAGAAADSKDADDIPT